MGAIPIKIDQYNTREEYASFGHNLLYISIEGGLYTPVKGHGLAFETVAVGLPPSLIFRFF